MAERPLTLIWNEVGKWHYEANVADDRLRDEALYHFFSDDLELFARLHRAGGALFQLMAQAKDVYGRLSDVFDYAFRSYSVVNDMALNADIVFRRRWVP